MAFANDQATAALAQEGHFRQIRDGSSESTAHETFKKSVTVLASSKLGNQSGPKTTAEAPSSESYPMDKLLARLSEQHALIREQNETLRSNEDDVFCRATLEHVSSSTSLPITPATEGFPSTAPTTRPASAALNDTHTNGDELLRLKLELAQAQNKISRLDQELAHAQTRTGKHDQNGNTFVPPRVPNSASGNRENGWSFGEDDRQNQMGVSAFNRNRGIWSNPNPRPYAPSMTPQPGLVEPSGNFFGGRGFNGNGYFESPGSYAGPDSYRNGRLTPDCEALARAPGGRRNRFDNRNHNFNSNFGNFGPGGHFDPMASNGVSGLPLANVPPNGAAGMSTNPANTMTLYGGYHPQPIGTPLSPHATEFTASVSSQAMTTEGGQTYLSTTEPLNYRRLLDRSVNCNWKYIVDKIVCNNDQQASIFLQQKLKVGTPEQKYEIVEAIIAQAYPLMVNRFGNFLVQRCFEHGTPEQIIKIAEAIRGNTLTLSMDAFGCHVVQKAFDSVPEDYKAVMVSELLRRIPETVIHRYACHVWQKLFELRWQESPPQIMKYVNESLRGMWHDVALGETGSLVVQNIFENCLEEDKRPCVEAVLKNIDIVAHGQFGNWCIQHICEHGAPGDRSRAIDHVIRYAAEYSIDQFASKVVEKCLKIGGGEFLGRYLERVCEGRADRPRIPLIDIASDQYGNYLIQYILTHANSQHREVVMVHIRKHMVSLRGSKFGSRVGMLCTNPAVATRPGPGSGTGIGVRMGHGPRFGGGIYR